MNPDQQCLQDFRFLPRNIKREWHRSAARVRQVVRSRKYGPDLARLGLSQSEAAQRGRVRFNAPYIGQPGLAQLRPAWLNPVRLPGWSLLCRNRPRTRSGAWRRIGVSDVGVKASRLQNAGKPFSSTGSRPGSRRTWNLRPTYEKPVGRAPSTLKSSGTREGAGTEVSRDET